MRRLTVGAIGILTLCAAADDRGRAQPTTPRIQLVREQVLDGEREDFSVVNGGHANGRMDLALTLRQDFQVRTYDARGARLATMGRRGQAPGEFLLPQVQGWIADTVWVYDPSLRRHSYFTRDGRLLRTVPLEASGRATRVLNDAPGAQLVDFFPIARRDDGALVGSATIVRDGKDGRRARERVVASYSPDGTAKRLASTEQDSRWDAALALTTAFAISPNGREVAVTTVSDLTLRGSEILVSRFDTGVRLTGIGRIAYNGVEYPPQLRDRVLKRGAGPDQEKAVRTSRLPLVLPPVTNVLLRDDGIALLTIQRSTDSLSAILVDAHGQVNGAFALPNKADVIATRGGRVWLRERNGDDVTSVVRYKLLCGSRACFPE